MKKMKSIYKICLLGVLITFSSCEKKIFEEPYNSLSPADAFSSPERIEKAATGMYDALQNLEFFGGRVLIYTDIRGIDTGAPSYFAQIPQFNTLSSTNADIRLSWQAAYRTINETNLFTKNLEANPGKISDELTLKYNSEAKYIRALSYFYLVNLWAQPYKFTADGSHLGVPLILTVADDPFATSNQVARNTVAEVYTQIENDLLDAAVNLPSAPATKSFQYVARATKGAAYGLLARTYLYKQDYNKALEYANKVIDLSVYSLNPSPVDAFETFTTNESIFSVAHSGGDNPNTNHALGQHYSPTKRADISISPDYVNLMDVDDLRRSELIISQNSAFWTTKYTAVTDWVPVLRYSEILLIKAEALANLAAGTTVDATALALVNEVRQRSSPAETITAATKQDLIAAILLERRIELAFEGQGLFEFLRTGRNVPEHGIVPEQPYGSDYVVFPIPFNDMQKNPNLVPNPGY